MTVIINMSFVFTIVNKYYATKNVSLIAQTRYNHRSYIRETYYIYYLCIKVFWLYTNAIKFISLRRQYFHVVKYSILIGGRVSSQRFDWLFFFALKLVNMAPGYSEVATSEGRVFYCIFRL